MAFNVVKPADNLARWCHRDGRDHDGRVALWAAVIERAILDLDIAWIRSPSFAEVCALAGLEPDHTRRKILADPEGVRQRVLHIHSGHSRLHVPRRDRRPKRMDTGPGFGLPDALQFY